MNNPSLKRLPAVLVATGLARSTVYREIRAGRFPAPVHVGPRLSAWLAAEVDAWIAERVAERDNRACD